MSRFLFSRDHFAGILCAGLLAMAGCCTTAPMPDAAPETSGDFSSPTIDFGIVVSDMDKMAKFYIEVVGMKQVNTFKAPAELAGGVGLTDNKGADVRFLALDDGKTSTKLKLLYISGAKPAAGDNRFIHSTVGISYTTFFVKDMDAAIQRVKAAGVKLLGKSPLPLPNGEMFLLVMRDPDGNFVELVGPKASE